MSRAIRQAPSSARIRTHRTSRARKETEAVAATAKIHQIFHSTDTGTWMVYRIALWHLLVDQRILLINFGTIWVLVPLIETISHHLHVPHRTINRSKICNTVNALKFGWFFKTELFNETNTDSRTGLIVEQNDTFAWFLLRIAFHALSSWIRLIKFCYREVRSIVSFQSLRRQYVCQLTFVHR